MLGNFSFGDYFKEGAIEHAWRFITKELKLDPARLMVSIAPSDDEAAMLWKKIAGFSDNKIVRLEENFWSMGDTGPCGTNTEIFYDHGDHVAGGPPGSPDEDGDRFVEIWNLVFMQFEQHANGDRTSLPKPSIDTGMGLERVAAVLQGVHDNYDVDLFRDLIAASKRELGAADEATTPSHRVIADHLRSTSFLIADGVTPSNEGRGYVLRRILRRAVRHAWLLGRKEPTLVEVVKAVIATMSDVYPELKQREQHILNTTRVEEQSFLDTIEGGLSRFEQLAPERSADGSTEIHGSISGDHA
jgi:alanyl-tRNA synthetase